MNSGIAVHCHHEELFEYVYDYDQRVEYIRDYKPMNEVGIRLAVFKLVPEKYFPAAWVKTIIARHKTYVAWNKANAELDKAKAFYRTLDKARAEVDKAYVVFYKADDAWHKTNDAWDKADQEEIHKLVCGCKYWNGEKLVFDSSFE